MPAAPAEVMDMRRRDGRRRRADAPPLLDDESFLDAEPVGDPTCNAAAVRSGCCCWRVGDIASRPPEETRCPGALVRAVSVRRPGGVGLASGRCRSGVRVYAARGFGRGRATDKRGPTVRTDALTARGVGGRGLSSIPSSARGNLGDYAGRVANRYRAG